MSLTETSVPAVAWKQYRFKTKIYAANLITLLAAQLLGLLLSLRGVGFSGYSTETVTYQITYISGDIIVVITLIWAFVVGYNLAGNSFKQDFVFVSNRLSSHFSNIAYLLTSAVIAGVTASLGGILLRVLVLLAYGGQNHFGLFIPPLDLAGGIFAAILYALLVSAGGYLFGMLVQLSRAFIVLVPGLLIGALYMEVKTTGQARLLLDAINFFVQESSYFLFFVKVFLAVVLGFALVIFFSQRMEVRK
ncbi:MAG TPA: hypothetical protein PLS32_05745 [Bacillota bacterium]|nr:hypothetical protein [Bacillota bacterium]